MELDNERPKRARPPRMADALFKNLFLTTSQEEILGDMHELFEKQREKRGLWQARILYWWDVICFFCPDIIHDRSMLRSGSPADWSRRLSVLMDRVKEQAIVTIHTLTKRIRHERERDNIDISMPL